MLTIILEKLVYKYPSPSVINSWWNFGFMNIILCVLQIFTGLLSVMHYDNNSLLAFTSIIYMDREVLFGDSLHLIHAVGASLFFFVAYLHVVKGLYYGSYLYPRHRVWLTGVLILLILQVIGFLGYVLPWGQMGYWATVVITTMVTVIPMFGYNIMLLFWGDFAMSDTCLMRAFCLHYLMPFVLLALSIWHVLALHEYGSSSPFGTYIDKITLSAYFLVKDMDFTWGLIWVWFLYCLVIPDTLAISANLIMASKRVTPAHIAPEWYMQPFYCILRSIPDKVWGIILMASTYVTIVTLDFTRLGILLKRSSKISLIVQCIFFFIVPCWILLTFYGGQPFEFPVDLAGALVAICFFSYFWFFNFNINLINFIIFWGGYYFLLIKIIFEIQYKQKGK